MSAPSSELSSLAPNDAAHGGPPPAPATNIPFGPWGKLLQYARTVRHLEPVQIYSRFLPQLPARQPTYSPQWRPLKGRWLEPIRKGRAQTGPCRFRFLNLEREISSWNDNSLSQLWLYNLHYFEHSDELLVERWIAENDTGEGIGWAPYPTSLRIANWCKWILNGASRTKSVALSLASQALWLETHLERHLLANHLLANAKALLFAGCVLECPDAARWRKTGLEILAEELPRQLLSDGAHVERSPMYHSIVLEDLLDLYNLSQAFSGLLPDFSVNAGRMLRWLEWMTHPDGQISFFNDAAFGVAPPLPKLQAYARRLDIRSQALLLGESGYVRLDNDRLVLIFDAAPLGPDYQPGHGHADALSFELSRGDRRILVNSGTSTYDAGPMRAFERGTAAHNTVRIDGMDQSEMWASFRVARRARPFGLKTDQRSFAEAAHDGYHRLGAKVTHRRRITLTNDHNVMISDWLVGSGSHDVELFFHFAPGANPAIQFDPRLTVSTFPTVYSTGFNQRIPNQTVVGRWSGPCPVRFDTRIDVSRA
jgi:Heparinase II/III-like protein/Heparinase II/III N-terminus